MHAKHVFGIFSYRWSLTFVYSNLVKCPLLPEISPKHTLTLTYYIIYNNYNIINYLLPCYYINV